MKPKAEKELLRESQKQKKQQETEMQNQQQNMSKTEGKIFSHKINLMFVMIVWQGP